MNQSDGKPDVQQGLYRKYNVERLNDPTGKHKDCHYYVLDLVHDKHAVQALLAYAASCETEFPTLAFGLRREAATTARRLGVALSETPPQPASEAGQLLAELEHVLQELKDEPMNYHSQIREDFVAEFGGLCWAHQDAVLAALRSDGVSSKVPEGWEIWIEFGYKARERGVNLIAAIEDARSRMYAAAPSPDKESK